MAPVDFQQGTVSGSTISVDDTQIVITNELTNQPLCSTALPCADAFVDFSFAFAFSGGVHITDVAVDPSSTADFRPVSGGLTFNPTDIFVNVVGDNPAAGDKLISGCDRRRFYACHSRTFGLGDDAAALRGPRLRWISA